MNCPNCLSVMYCSTEIIKLSNNLQRMDLHCYNKDCPSRTVSYIPHMGVFVYPDKRWECCNYNLPFKHNDEWYSLIGGWSLTKINYITKQKSGWVALPGGGAYNKKCLTDFYSIVSIGFVPLSIDNDMHVEANKLFNRLINLVVFT